MTIADALDGRDVCGKAKTGSGKTLGFGLPMLQRVAAERRASRRAGGPARPRGSCCCRRANWPSRSTRCSHPLGKALGLHVNAVYGGADIERQVKSLQKGCDIIIATPGRLIDLGDRGEINVEGLDVLVLDEADRMADMGFMPQVEWVLRRIAEHPHQTLLFSATLDGAIDRLVKRYLTDPVFHEVASDTQTVTLMAHHFLNVHQMDRIKVAAAICNSFDKTIIFCRTKRGADRLVEQLQKEGVDAAAIHGDLRQSQREKALADFGADSLSVLVATDVAARGLHIDGVDCVMHFDPPEDHKAYLHRSGRTARAGSTGVVVSLLLYNQIIEAEVIMRRLGTQATDRRSILEQPAPEGPSELGPDQGGLRTLSKKNKATPVYKHDKSIKRALVVVAHPDDIDFGSAGTVATLTKHGVDVAYCLVTSGDAGGTTPPTPKRSVPRSARPSRRAAAKEVGVSSLTFLRWPDGQVEPTMLLRREIARVIRTHKPDLVITQSPERNWERIYASHPDHLAVGEATLRAVYPDARNPHAFPELLREGFEPHVVPEVWLTSAQPNMVVDISKVFDHKMAALKQHESQVGDRKDLEKMLRRNARLLAKAAGLGKARLAEGYKVVTTK